MGLPSMHLKSMRKSMVVAVAVVITMTFAPGLASNPADPALAGAQHAGRYPVRSFGAAALPVSHFAGDELPARGKFLVASPGMTDPRFQETVILLIGYDSTGATGLIINRPTQVTLAELLPFVPGLTKRSDVAYYGGPVEGQRMFMLVRSREKPDESENVFADVYVSVSKNTLERMIQARKTDKKLRVYSGYARWFPGQLDKEVSLGGWYIVNADADAIFEKEASQLWPDLIGRSSAIEVWKHDKDNPPLSWIRNREQNSRTFPPGNERTIPQTSI